MMLMEFIDLVDAGASYTLKPRRNLQLPLLLPIPQAPTRQAIPKCGQAQGEAKVRIA